VRAVQLNAFEIHKALEAGFLLPPSGREPVRLTLKPPKELSFEPNTPAATILSEVLARGVQIGASDIHFESYENDIDVRVRVDGILHHLNTALSRENIAAVVSRLKILAGLDIAERRVAQDGRVNAVLEDGTKKRNIDFRVSVVPGPFGEDAVLRILDSAKPLLGLDDLGFAREELARLESLITNPEGMLLVTGPTGSGKTTTLYAAINQINTINNKILTVEDPIEYLFPKVNQKQVSDQMGFAAYARSFMRQNPDIILIGEIRDEETAEAALRAAQTGHLVLSTLHTGDAVRTVSRLRTLGLESGLVASTLLGAISQRLLRRLCPACRREAPASLDERRRLCLKDGERGFFAAGGCAECGGDGYRGRIGAYELFVLDEELAELIADETPAHRIRQRALEKGMRSLLDDALDKAQAGSTTLAEILRVVPYRIIATDRG
jgi:general secretion pathway protein E/type IV pilus assembly protein PilB